MKKVAIFFTEFLQQPQKPLPHSKEKLSLIDSTFVFGQICQYLAYVLTFTKKESIIAKHFSTQSSNREEPIQWDRANP